jgi:hypothetical protein
MIKKIVIKFNNLFKIFYYELINNYTKHHSPVKTREYVLPTGLLWNHTNTHWLVTT